MSEKPTPEQVDRHIFQRWNGLLGRLAMSEKTDVGQRCECGEAIHLVTGNFNFTPKQWASNRTGIIEQDGHRHKPAAAPLPKAEQPKDPNRWDWLHAIAVGSKLAQVRLPRDISPDAVRVLCEELKEAESALAAVKADLDVLKRAQDKWLDTSAAERERREKAEEIIVRARQVFDNYDLAVERGHGSSSMREVTLGRLRAALSTDQKEAK